jgi:hypothetical protein
LLGADGADAGGVYVTLVAVAPERLPQVGEQEAPFAVSVQVTPLLPFWTVALNVTAAVPAVTEVILLVIVTETEFPLPPLPWPALHPAMARSVINTRNSSMCRSFAAWSGFWDVSTAAPLGDGSTKFWEKRLKPRRCL